MSTEKGDHKREASTDNNRNLDISLEEALGDSTRMMILFMNNRFVEAISLLKGKMESNMIYPSTLGLLKSIDGLLSADNDIIAEAMAFLQISNDSASTFRKKFSYRSLLFKFDYDSYTDEEALAELVYAQTLIIIGLLSIIGDQSIYGIFKAALKVRSSHTTYEECLNILNHKNNWSSNRLKVHFESGTRLGIGGFDLFVSLFPNKLAKLLEYIGFNSDRQVALEELNKSVRLVDGFAYDLTSIFLMAFHGFIEYFWGCGEGNISHFEVQSKVWEDRYHNSIIGNIILAIWAVMTGKPDEAIKHFECSDSANAEWHQLHYVCKFGTAACYVAKCDWKAGMDNMKILSDESKLSPALFTYLYSVFLFMYMDENTEKGSEEREKMLTELIVNLRKIPKLKRTVGGKKVFHEKLVIERSKRYVDCPSEMVLPVLELVYIWNFFAMMYGNEQLINGYLDRINAKYLIHENDKDDSSRTNLDEYAYLTFMRGVCYRHLGMLNESKDSFNEVLLCEKKISDGEKHLLPQSCYELGLIERKKCNYQDCKKWLKKARDEYDNYMTDVMIRYRAQILLNEQSKY